MRRLLLYFLTMCLVILVVRRVLLPEPVAAQETSNTGHSYGYNILELDLPLAPETAGSALLAELNGYYLFRTPTSKSAYTGTLVGKNLILICADNWRPDPANKSLNPTLYRLWQEGIHFTDVYRPDWYQGMDGREFALLSGLVPTNIDGETAMVWVGEQDIYLPYALGKALTGEGYQCYAFTKEEAHAPGYGVLGFSSVEECARSAQDTVAQTAARYMEDERFFVYYVWNDADGEAALAELMVQLKKAGREDDTILCILTGNDEDDRAHLFLWSQGLSGTVNKPCSELDVTPTLLDLMGVAYDARFLSGADVFAQNTQADTASDAATLVSLYGSAYSDWVTAAGSYSAQDNIFFLYQDCFSQQSDVTSYVAAVKSMVYDRYVYTRKALEMNYFQVVLGF